MGRPAFAGAGAIGLLDIDTILFVADQAGDHPDAHAQDGRDNGLDVADDHADGAADFGQTVADEAPGSTPPADPPGGPPSSFSFGSLAPGRGSGNSGTDTIVLLDPILMGGKGGTPGKPDKGGGGGDGGGGGGGGGETLYSSYWAGEYNGEDGYDILIDFKGDGWTLAMQEVFIQAAEYFTGSATSAALITGDIGGGGKYHGKTIDDLYLTAEISYIDGAGGILGQAGPTAAWNASHLTAAGTIQFDTADAGSYFNAGYLDDITTHELMHVLGFGTLWEYYRDLVNDSFEYTGTEANAAYGGTLMVESDGGPGTAGGHWDEAAYDNELMTGYIDDDNYLSEWSVMALADLGYEIDYQDYPYDGYTAA